MCPTVSARSSRRSQPSSGTRLRPAVRHSWLFMTTRLSGATRTTSTWCRLCSAGTACVYALPPTHRCLPRFLNLSSEWTVAWARGTTQQSARSLSWTAHRGPRWPCASTTIRTPPFASIQVCLTRCPSRKESCPVIQQCPREYSRRRPTLQWSGPLARIRSPRTLTGSLGVRHADPTWPVPRSGITVMSIRQFTSGRRSAAPWVYSVCPRRLASGRSTVRTVSVDSRR